MSCFSSNSRWLRFFNTSIKATLKSAESDEISAPLLPSWEKGEGRRGMRASAIFLLFCPALSFYPSSASVNLEFFSELLTW
jgi:hypothetical protein